MIQQAEELLDAILNCYSTEGYRDRDWVQENPVQDVLTQFVVDVPGDQCGQLFDRLAVHTAKRFLASELSFDLADEVMNDAYCFALFFERSGYVYPALFDAIYSAFDGGEDSHFGKYDDPVNQVTVPQLKTIFAETTFT